MEASKFCPKAVVSRRPEIPGPKLSCHVKTLFFSAKLNSVKVLLKRREPWNEYLLQPWHLNVVVSLLGLSPISFSVSAKFDN